MLEAGSILLQVVWLIGMVSAWHFGGLIHLLLVGAIVLIALRLFGRAA